MTNTVTVGPNVPCKPKLQQGDMFRYAGGAPQNIYMIIETKEGMKTVLLRAGATFSMPKESFETIERIYDVRICKEAE